jgi:hypothetical protein
MKGLVKMTSRFTLLFAVAGIATLARCSAPAEGGGGDPPPAPLAPPPLGQGGTTGLGQGGTSPVGSAQGGTTQTAQGGTTQTAQGGTTNAGNAGTTGLPGTGEIPIGTGLAITPNAEGWVDGMTNGLGIQGAFFPASDAGMTAATPTTITLDAATTPGSICVSGTLAQIAELTPATDTTAATYDFTTYWGALVGMNLRQVLPAGGGEAMPASPWPRTTPAGNVTGFTHTITANAGSTLPDLRFTVDFVGKPAGSTYCQPIPLGAPSTNLGTVVESCWEAGGVALPGSDLLAIQWSIIPSTAAPTPFNFCISNVNAIVGP